MTIWEKLNEIIKQFFKYASSVDEVKPPQVKVDQPQIKDSPVKSLDDLKKIPRGTPAWYRAAFDLCKIDDGYASAVAGSVAMVLKGKAIYQSVEKQTGVPWYVIGCIHFKEASCNWSACLHNGEHIIGTGRKTTIVPKGRGPFSTWYEAAVDAMKGESLGKIKDWELGQMLMACEKYNGWGYQTGAGKAENSPYLWSRSNINDDFGRYVADGKFDPNSGTNKTSGLAVIMKELEKMGEIKVKRI